MLTLCDITQGWAPPLVGDNIPSQSSSLPNISAEVFSVIGGNETPWVYELLENISIALSYYGWAKPRLPQWGPAARPQTQRYTPDQIPPGVKIKVLSLSSWPLSPCCSALEGIRKHNSREVLTEHPGRRLLLPPAWPHPACSHLPRASCSHSRALLHSDTCVSGGGRSAAHRPAVKPEWRGRFGWISQIENGTTQTPSPRKHGIKQKQKKVESSGSWEHFCIELYESQLYEMMIFTALQLLGVRGYGGSTSMRTFRCWITTIKSNWECANFSVNTVTMSCFQEPET